MGEANNPQLVTATPGALSGHPLRKPIRTDERKGREREQPMKLDQFEEMAREMVGDGQEPNTFFASIEGRITLVTTDFQTAYDYWQKLSRYQETALEDRQNGVLASTEPDEETGRLYTHDDAERFIIDNPIRAAA